jgi:uncharacterized protein YqjF (DUF2071 family)
MTSPGDEPVTATAPVLPRPLLMRQQWLDLSSVHWAVDPDVVAPHLPPGTRPDLLRGKTYVGLLPFRMVAAGVSTGPAVPWLGSFLETNVRLYSVDATGRRGVVFCSLDANRLAVVAGASTIFGLPYRWASMSHTKTPTPQGDEHAYAMRLRWPRVDDGVVTSRMVVRDSGPLRADDDVELATFVSARWGLHVRHWGRTWYIPNEHAPWPLHRAVLVRLEDQLVAVAGWPQLLDRKPALVLYSPGVAVRFGRPSLASTPRRR